MIRFKIQNILAYMIVLSLLTSCGAINRLNIFSPKEEVELGKQASYEIERSIRIYRDPVVHAYIDSLGQALVRASGMSQFRYYFKVVDAPEINAFALPGGYIYVNLGLIKAAETESELAGVIGHEIGHVEERHGGKKLTRLIGIGALVEFISGEGEQSLGRKIAGYFAGWGGGLVALKYGREAERESDKFAIQCLLNAGVHPEGLASFFETLLELHKSQPSGVKVWFSTHPPTQSRVDFVRSEVAKLPSTIGLKKTSTRFNQIRTRVSRRR